MICIHVQVAHSRSRLGLANTEMTFDILAEQGANDREEVALQLALRALFK